jgi:hypothetical protein
LEEILMKRAMTRLLVTAALSSLVFSPVQGDPSGDDVALRIARALTCYLEGNASEAADLLEGVLFELRPTVAPPPAGPDVPSSNTGQLLDYLDLYALYVRGDLPALDRVHDLLRGHLLGIEAIHAVWPRPREFDGFDLEFDPFSQLVRRVGDLEISYDPFTQQIREVGGFEIDYDPFHHHPVRMGGIEFEHDPFDHRVVEIAGVEIR